MDDSKVQEMLVMFDSGIGVAGIANEFGVSTQTVRRILKDHGKETSRKPRTLDDEAVIQMYQDGKPVPEILTRHTITYGTLYRILGEHEVPTRQVAYAKSALKILDRAVELYVAGAPLWSIKQETGIAQPTLHAELHKREIPLRRPRML